MESIVFIGIGVIAIFGLYALTAAAMRSRFLSQMERQKRMLPWSEALAKVQNSEGYFLTLKSGSHIDLYYSPGVPSNDRIVEEEICRDRALLVTLPPKMALRSELRAQGLDAKCIELNADALR